MHKLLIPSTLLAAALACSSLAFAAAAPPPAPGTSSGTTAGQTWHHGMRHRGMHQRGMHHRGRPGMRVLHRLKLTDAQRSRVRQLIRQDFDRARTGMRSLRQQRMAFRNATPGSSSYQAAANNLAQAEANAARARVLRQAELRTGIYGVLTPAQRTQLASMRSRREAKMKQWRESHMHQPTGAPASSAAH